MIDFKFLDHKISHDACLLIKTLAFGLKDIYKTNSNFKTMILLTNYLISCFEIRKTGHLLITDTRLILSNRSKNLMKKCTCLQRHVRIIQTNCVLCSLRWHYPNQVKGRDEYISSQPTQLPAPLLS